MPKGCFALHFITPLTESSLQASWLERGQIPHLQPAVRVKNCPVQNRIRPMVRVEVTESRNHPSREAPNPQRNLLQCHGHKQFTQPQVPQLLVVTRGKGVSSICKPDKTNCLNISNHQAGSYQRKGGANQPRAERKQDECFPLQGYQTGRVTVVTEPVM